MGAAVDGGQAVGCSIAVSALALPPPWLVSSIDAGTTGIAGVMEATTADAAAMPFSSVSGSTSKDFSRLEKV